MSYWTQRGLKGSEYLFCKVLANHDYTISAPAAEPEAMAEPQPDPEAKPIIGLIKSIFGK